MQYNLWLLLASTCIVGFFIIYAGALCLFYKVATDLKGRLHEFEFEDVRIQLQAQKDTALKSLNGALNANPNKQIINNLTGEIEDVYDWRTHCDKYLRMIGEKGQSALQEEMNQLSEIVNTRRIQIPNANNFTTSDFINDTITQYQIVDFSPSGIFEQTINALERDLLYYNCSCVSNFHNYIILAGFCLGGMVMGCYISRSKSKFRELVKEQKVGDKQLPL